MAFTYLEVTLALDIVSQILEPRTDRISMHAFSHTSPMLVCPPLSMHPTGVSRHPFVRKLH